LLAVKTWQPPVTNRNIFVSDLIDGIDYITSLADQIDVANLSSGLDGTAPRSITDAITRSVASGVVYVVAVANAGRDSTNDPTNPSVGDWPENHPDVIAVSNVVDTDGRCGGYGPNFLWARGGSIIIEGDDTLASTSNYGSVVDLAAPGTNIQTTYRDGGYAMGSGASFAAPYVAGAAALYIAHNPFTPPSPSEVRDALVAAGSTTELPQCEMGRDDGRGYFKGDRDSYPEPLLFVPPLTVREELPLDP